MALVEWDDKYSVHVEEIDNQHKKLLELIDVLNEAVGKEGDKEVVDDVLKELHEYAIYHFKTEEDYFHKFKYSESASHEEEHRGFVQRIKAFEYLYKSGRVTLAGTSVLMYLLEWLMAHIVVEDGKYVKCFKASGLK